MGTTLAALNNDQNRNRQFTAVVAGSRTYVFAVKTNRAGRRYLSITETRSDKSAEPHTRLTVFQTHMKAFHTAYLKAAKRLEPKLRAYDVAKIREAFPNAYKKWTPEDDQQLVASFKQGVEVLELGRLFGRQPGGIMARLRTFGMATGPSTSTPSSPGTAPSAPPYIGQD